MPSKDRDQRNGHQNFAYDLDAIIDRKTKARCVPIQLKMRKRRPQ